MRKVLFAAWMILLGATFARGDEHDNEAIYRVPEVVDAQGRMIGDLTTFGLQDGVLFSVGNQHVVIGIERKRDPDDTYLTYSASQFQWSTSPTVYFASSDCSGDPVIASQIGPWPALAFRSGTEVTVYFARNVPQRSFLVTAHRDSPSPECIALDRPFAMVGYPAGAKIVITRGHPEPLTISY